MEQFSIMLPEILGSASFGWFALIYAVYLKITHKLPYSIEKTLKPDKKDEFLKHEIICLILIYLVFQSLGFFFLFASPLHIAIIIIHVVMLIGIIIYRGISRRKFFI